MKKFREIDFLGHIIQFGFFRQVNLHHKIGFLFEVLHFSVKSTFSFKIYKRGDFTEIFERDHVL